MSKRPILEVKLICLGAFLYPTRIYWQTVFEQNKRRFYMHITEGHETNETQSGSRCTSGSKYRAIESTPSVAITNNKELLDTSLIDVYFCAFGFEVENFLIYVTNIGIGNNINTIGVSFGYTSSFIGEYEKKRALFVQ
ncbi:hypothetical protein Glove_365g252 [Diversispora epigaea]|uniref:Uncharacterized protein n=1 Tax=Diversispora epigaea TaxID=1348612 RepID=A0A397H8W7_9GLOM|nr:hypothetical protein Glove_365g252 [Diversispora epigaea]